VAEAECVVRACGVGNSCPMEPATFDRREEGPATALEPTPAIFAVSALLGIVRFSRSELTRSTALVLLCLPIRKLGADWTPTEAASFSSLFC
jgi:hypothetical protein